MPSVTRLGDSSTGHGPFPPRGNDSAASTVFANGIAVHRLGDHWPAHTDGNSVHDETTSQGSSTVFAENKNVARIGDPCSQGDHIAAGSENVFAGG